MKQSKINKTEFWKGFRAHDSGGDMHGEGSI